MRYLLIFIILEFIAYLTDALNLLLLGDSIDRFITQDWCHSTNNPALGRISNSRAWGDSSMADHRQGSVTRCDDHYNNDSISFVQIFGSSAAGPYHKGFGASPNDKTAVRIAYVLKVYSRQFGYLPDRLFFHTNQWDLPDEYRYGKRYRDSLDWSHHLAAFRNNTIERMNQLRELLSNSSVEIGMRTAVWGNDGGIECHKMNNIVRQIASDMNFTFFDMDRDAWSAVFFAYHRQSDVLRDRIHPREFITAPAGDKMLGRRYSRFFKQVPRSPEKWQCGQIHYSNVGVTNPNLFSELEYKKLSRFSPESLCNQVYRFSVQLVEILPSNNTVRGIGDTAEVTTNYSNLLATAPMLSDPILQYNASNLFYLHSINGTIYKWTNVTREFLWKYHFGPGDVYSIYDGTFESEYVKNIPLRGAIPLKLLLFEDTFRTGLSGRVGVITNEGHVMARKSHSENLDHLQFESEFSKYELNADEILRGIDSFWIHMCYYYHGTIDYSLLRFHDGLLIRHAASKQIYLIQHGMKHGIPSMEVLKRHNLDLSKVMVLKYVEELNMIPTGGDLN